LFLKFYIICFFFPIRFYLISSHTWRTSWGLSKSFCCRHKWWFIRHKIYACLLLSFFLKFRNFLFQNFLFFWLFMNYFFLIVRKSWFTWIKSCFLDINFFQIFKKNPLFLLFCFNIIIAYCIGTNRYRI
jgi:hypothetical protein